LKSGNLLPAVSGNSICGAGSAAAGTGLGTGLFTRGRGCRGIVGGAHDPFKFTGSAFRAFHLDLFIFIYQQKLNQVIALQASKFVYGHWIASPL
jgi:hypothetical protein